MEQKPKIELITQFDLRRWRIFFRSHLGILLAWISNVVWIL